MDHNEFSSRGGPGAMRITIGRRMLSTSVEYRNARFHDQDAYSSLRLIASADEIVVGRRRGAVQSCRGFLHLGVVCHRSQHHVRRHPIGVDKPQSFCVRRLILGRMIIMGVRGG
jgi:hypothetical protein